MTPNEPSSRQEDQLTKLIVVGLAGPAIGGTIIGAIAMPQLRSSILFFVLIALVLIVICGGFLWFLRSQHHKGVSKTIADSIKRKLGMLIDSPVPPDVKERLITVQKKFQSLTDKLHQQGKNLYDLPWFITLGPSGSGKSWVLKGGGLQPLLEVEWEKGTRMLDWWTSSEAMVLDTAGGVVFNENIGCDTPEWEFIMSLLKENRPHCPINGILVMVPAQLLWLKTSELPEAWLSLDRYASALQKQLREILPNALSVRLPVYLVVTQCDRLPGFRGFADGLRNNNLSTEQLLGWSNRAKAGEMTKPGDTMAGLQESAEWAEIRSVGSHLREVASHVRRHRLQLLRAYVAKSAPQDQGGMEVRSRAGELFAFADVIQSSVTPNLESFLTRVFEPKPELPLPPFLRGVYFTSALREGEVLDRQAAGLLGKSMKSLALPGQVRADQANPFFIRDLFYTKVNLEAWLVTPLVQVMDFLSERRRRLQKFGVVAGLFILLVIFSAGYLFKKTVGEELMEWEKVKQGAVNSPDYWMPILKTNDKGEVEIDSANLEFHQSLARRSRLGLESDTPWYKRSIFWDATLDAPRRQAQLRTFEKGVLKNLADLARTNILHPNRHRFTSSAEELVRLTDAMEGALLAVAELEYRKPGDTNQWEFSRDRVIRGLVNLVLEKQTESTRRELIINLRKLHEDTYADRRQQWPPQFAKESRTFPEFAQGTFAALERLQDQQVESLKNAKTQLSQFLQDAVAAMSRETAFLESITTRSDLPRLSEELQLLKSAWAGLNKTLSDKTGTRSFVSKVQEFRSVVQRASEGRLGRLRKELEAVEGAGKPGISDPVLLNGMTRLENKSPKNIAALLDLPDSDAQLADRSLLDGNAPSVVNALSVCFIEKRLEMYEKLLVASSFRLIPPRLEKPAVLEGRTAEVSDLLRKESTNQWNRLISGSPEAFTNLLQTVDQTDLPALKTVLLGHLQYRGWEDFLTRCSAITSSRLKDSDLLLPEMVEPGATLREVGRIYPHFSNLKKNWVSFIAGWVELGGPANRWTAVVRAIDHAEESTTEAVNKRIQIAVSSLNGFPFSSSSQGKVTDLQARTAWETLQAWNIACSNALAVSGPERLPAHFVAVWQGQIRTLLGRFDGVMDKEGDFLNYDLLTPWAPAFEARFQQILNAKSSRLDEARVAAANNRGSLINGNKFDPSNPDAKAVCGAFDPFSIAVGGVHSGGQRQASGLPAPDDNWGILRFIADGVGARWRQEAPPYFIPIRLQDGDGPSRTIWIVVKPRKDQK